MIGKILAIAALLAAFATPANELRFAIDAWVTGGVSPGFVARQNEAISAALPEMRRDRYRR